MRNKREKFPEITLTLLTATKGNYLTKAKKLEHSLFIFFFKIVISSFYTFLNAFICGIILGGR